MRKLDGTRLRALPVSGLKHVRDLDYLNGPLLSQYAHPSGDAYLYYWCDCDNKVIRWMGLRVSEANILGLVNTFVPLASVRFVPDFTNPEESAFINSSSVVTI